MNPIASPTGNTIFWSCCLALARILSWPFRAFIALLQKQETALVICMMTIVAGCNASYFWNNTSGGVAVTAITGGLLIGFISWFMISHLLANTRFVLFDKKYDSEKGSWHYYHPTFMIFWIFAPAIIALYAFGVCSYNWSIWNTQKVMVVDGAPITDSTVRWHIPFLHDIQVIHKDMSVNNIECKGTTKDGMPVMATVNVTLRRADDPKKWTSVARMNPSPTMAIRAAFAKACTLVTSDQIAASGLKIEFEAVKDLSLIHI
jgi:hypothetical protein